MGGGYTAQPYQQQSTFVNNQQMNMNMNYGNQQPQQFGGAPYGQPVPYDNNLFFNNQQPQYPAQNGPIYLGGGSH